jgi:hypothetical protein
LPDIGLNCLSAAARWRQACSFTLHFGSSLLAQAQSSYGAYQEKLLRPHGERGSLPIEDAFAYPAARASAPSSRCRKSTHPITSP